MYYTCMHVFHIIILCLYYVDAYICLYYTQRIIHILYTITLAIHYACIILCDKLCIYRPNKIKEFRSSKLLMHAYV